MIARRVRDRIHVAFVPLRLRHGMFWHGFLPSWGDLSRLIRRLVVGIVAVAALLALYAVADLVTRYGDLQAQLSAARNDALSASSVLADCLNGRALFLHPNNSGRGYSQTVVACEPAYSFDI